MRNYLLTISLFAIIAVSVPGVFAATPSDVQDNRNAVFNNVPLTIGNYLIVPNPSKTVNGIADAGSITIIDRNTGKTYSIDNPNPKNGDMFGEHVAVSEKQIVVGVPTDSLNGGNVIYVFDGASRLLLHTIESPRGKVYGQFGHDLNTVNGNIVTNDYSGLNNQFDDSIYVFNSETGDLMYTISSKDTQSLNFRGHVTTTKDGKMLIHGYDFVNHDATNDVIYAFDASDGALLYTIKNPGDSDVESFGTYVTEVGRHIIVGVPTCPLSCNDESSGVIYSFDSDTGSLQSTIEYPGNDHDETFGEFVMPVQGNVGAGLDDAIYVFDPDTGKLLYTENYPQDKSYEGLIRFVSGLQNADGSVETKTDSGLVLDRPQTVNSFGVPLDYISTNEMVMIDSRIVNPSDEEEKFTYQVKVMDSAGNMIQERWISGAIAPQRDTSASISWIPERTGTYNAIVSVGSDLESLGQSKTIDVTVGDDTIMSCSEGLIMVYKASDDSPVCVRPQSAEKLIERGWAKQA